MRRSALLGFAVAATLAGVLGWSFGKPNPFAHPFRFSAIFSAHNSLVPGQPLRIAGVDVGKVRSIGPAPDGQAAVEVKFDVTNRDALPLHDDLTLKIRPRMMLEGYDFVDLRPGTPEAPALRNGAVVPLTQTAMPVGLDQTISVLQSDVRDDLKTFLHEYSDVALGQGGARAFRESIPWQAPAYRDSAVANQATLGTEHHDLSRLLDSTAVVSHALTRDEQGLKDLITNLNVTAKALVVHEPELTELIPQLDRLLRIAYPALRDIEVSLPPTNRFARDATPAMRSSLPATRDAVPFFHELRVLLGPNELGALLPPLRPAVRDLTRVDLRSVPFLAETRTMSSCQNRVLTPWSRTPIPDPDFPRNSGQPVYKQLSRSLVGFSGESRVADANGPLLRYFTSSGAIDVLETGPTGEKMIGSTAFPILGVRPAPAPSHPPMRPDVPCELQEIPDLHAPSGPADPSPYTPNPVLTQKDRARRARAQQEIDRELQYLRRRQEGKPAVDPLRFNAVGERRELRRLGLPVPREVQREAVAMLKAHHKRARAGR